MNIFYNFLTVLITLEVSINCFPTENEPEASPIVTTKLGKIQGHVKLLDDNKTAVNAYEGIPYGEPPIGDLRFKKPVAITSKYNGTLDATQIKHSCMQSGMLISLDITPELANPIEGTPDEDCLYLKVWTPVSNHHANSKKAVMFWIHGGAFTSGTAFSAVYDARYIAALGDVVVVTTNYRLGPWGFVYGGSDQYPGNLGLHDQIMALKWTKDNIAAFGGNPDQITIFGESAGGMSVGALVLSPLTKGLFKRAILQSGAPNSFLGSQSKADITSSTSELAKALECNQTELPDKVKCITKGDNQEILKFLNKGSLNGNFFGPYYGDTILPIKPSEALKTGNFENKNIDIIFGTVKDEGSRFVASFFKGLKEAHPVITKKQSYGFIYAIFLLLKRPFATQAAEFYTKDLNDSDGDKLAQAVGTSFGDYQLTCPTITFGTALAKWMDHKRHNAFAYRMSHKPSLSALPGCVGWMGTCHGDDVLMLFGYPIKLRGIVFNEADYKLSHDMIHEWTHFAKTGKVRNLSVKWSGAINHGDAVPHVKFMDLNPADYHMIKDFYKDTCEGFWKQYD